MSCVHKNIQNVPILQAHSLSRFASHNRVRKKYTGQGLCRDSTDRSLTVKGPADISVCTLLKYVNFYMIEIEVISALSERYEELKPFI